ncbi:MAG: hypothetical protein P9L94_04490 [Candidatus Hinthialibacter antarcticus]|nr:hypothetical protein [Candidatus Hinthialibacter antarcticus]
MMEDTTPIQTETKSGSGFWIGFWLTLLLVAAVGGAGAYLDFRLQQFEDQIVQQQRDILQNRENAKVFTQNLTGTLDSLSTMMNQTVTSFTQHTTKLAAVIEKKEKSQSEYLQTAIEELNLRIQKENETLRISLAALSKELSDTNSVLRVVQAKAVSADQRAELANQKIAALQDAVENDFSNLTQLAKAMSESIQAEFETQAATFSRDISALNETSQRGLQKIDNQVASIDAAQRDSAKQVALLSENVSGVKSQQSDIAKTVADNANCVSGTVDTLQSNLKTMAGQLEVGFAAAVEQNDVLRSDLAEIGYTLTERTEDLLVQMIDAQKAVKQDSTSAEGIRTSLETYAQDVTKFMHTFAGEMSSLNQTVQTLTDRVIKEKSSSVAATVIEETIHNTDAPVVSEKTYDEETEEPSEPKTIGLNTLEFPQHDH